MNIADKLVKERRARLAAEMLLDQKSRELREANARLSNHARTLSETVVEQRQDLVQVQTEREELRGRNSHVESELERAHFALQQAQRPDGVKLGRATQAVADLVPGAGDRRLGRLQPFGGAQAQDRLCIDTQGLGQGQGHDGGGKGR